MISSPKEPEYVMDPHTIAYAKVRYILDASDNSSAIYKVSIKSPWTVVWFSHIIYCLSDYQRLYKQLPSQVDNATQILFNAVMFDECVWELWPEMATRGR